MKHKKQLITWNDSTSRQGWCEIEEFIKHTDNSDYTKVESLGFIVFEDDKRIIISDSVSKNNCLRDPMVIPKVCIVKRRNVN